jgi:hypothetical protein
MKRLLYGLIALPFFAGAALAQQPVPLTSSQMDQVTAGFIETDFSNTSATAVSIFQRPYLTDPTPNSITCPGCYLVINSPTIGVAAQFGPGFSPGTQFPP